MNDIICKNRPVAADEVLHLVRCSQCGCAITAGRALIASEKLILCERCYHLMVNPGLNGETPANWVA